MGGLFYDRLPLLAAGMVVAFSPQGGWKLRESVVRIHLDAGVFTTLLIRRFEGAVICGAVEGNELVETVTQTLECTAAAIKSAVTPARLTAILVALAENLLRHFDDTIKNVADGSAKLTGGRKCGARRRLNIGHDTGSGA